MQSDLSAGIVSRDDDDNLLGTNDCKAFGDVSHEWKQDGTYCSSDTDPRDPALGSGNVIIAID